MERMNATDLEGYHDDLLTHFKVISRRDAHGYPILIPLANSRRELRWSVLKAWVDASPAKVSDVLVSYGLFRFAFVPVYELVEETAAGPKVIAGTVALYDEVTQAFTPITDAQRRKLMQAYQSDVMVMRLTGEAFTTLNVNDPGATLFQWSSKFVRLLADNPGEGGERRLVVSCIASKSALAVGDPAQYHHGLALHVAEYLPCEGTPLLVDLVDDTDHPGPTGQPNFNAKAMDLGNLSPPVEVIR
jgi:hypothetical protein